MREWWEYVSDGGIERGSINIEWRDEIGTVLY